MNETWKPSVVELQPVKIDTLGRVTFIGDPIRDLEEIAEFMACGHQMMPHNGYTPPGYAMYRVVGEEGDEQFYAAKEAMSA